MNRPSLLTIILFLFSVNLACAQEINWESATTGGAIKGKISASIKKPAAESLPVIIYLKNLSAGAIDTKSDSDYLSGLQAEGYHVLELDYARHENAKSPYLSSDVLKLRQEIAAKEPKLLAGMKVDPSRIYILREGYRIKRDIEFARDGNRVLAMDIFYPASADKPVPIIMEITCDNQNRMGSGSLIFCRDTLLEMAQLEGFAAVMVDHPVPPPYKGIDDPMPQSLDRMKAAVGKLREIKSEINSSDKIGAIGFSRGGPFAAMLAMQGDVNAALVHGNRYDYGSLIEKDPMQPRFEKAWGKFDDNPDNWLKHGAMYYLTPKCAPMFLNTSNTESAEYQAGLALIDGVLTKLGIEHTYTVDQDGRGHRVTLDPARLTDIFSFFRKHLNQ